jgi:hypothetical protein
VFSTCIDGRMAVSLLDHREIFELAVQSKELKGGSVSLFFPVEDIDL